MLASSHLSVCMAQHPLHVISCSIPCVRCLVAALLGFAWVARAGSLERLCRRRCCMRGGPRGPRRRSPGRGTSWRGGAPPKPSTPRPSAPTTTGERRRTSTDMSKKVTNSCSMGGSVCTFDATGGTRSEAGSRPGRMAMCWTRSAHVWVAFKLDTCAIACSPDSCVSIFECACCRLCSTHRYWMYAAVRAGRQGILVSNDEMRDHIFQVRRGDGSQQGCLLPRRLHCTQSFTGPQYRKHGHTNCRLLPAMSSADCILRFQSSS